MEKMYIVLMSTNTKMGSFIRTFTRYKYNHIAISFDKELNDMYSFARYKHASSLVGGFVKEGKYRYIKNPPLIKVYEMPYSDNIKNTINKMEKEKEKYIYNTYSAIAYVFGKNIKIKNSFTCFEFINQFLTENYKSIKEFDLKNNNHIFEGNLEEYTTIEIIESDYFEKENIIKVILKTLKHFFRITKRIFEK